jgi:hypothetical protein
VRVGDVEEPASAADGSRMLDSDTGSLRYNIDDVGILSLAPRDTLVCAQLFALVSVTATRIWCQLANSHSCARSGKSRKSSSTNCCRTLS